MDTSNFEAATNPPTYQVATTTAAVTADENSNNHSDPHSAARPDAASAAVIAAFAASRSTTVTTAADADVKIGDGAVSSQGPDGGVENKAEEEEEEEEDDGVTFRPFTRRYALIIQLIHTAAILAVLAKKNRYVRHLANIILNYNTT